MVGKMPISHKEKLMNWNSFFWFILHLLLPTPNSNLALQHSF